MLLLGLISSQVVNETNFEINHHEHVSFFKAQLCHNQIINALPDGSNNSFQHLDVQTNQNNNDDMHYDQATKA